MVVHIKTFYVPFIVRQILKKCFDRKRSSFKNDRDKFESEEFEFKVIIQMKSELQYSHFSREIYS